MRVELIELRVDVLGTAGRCQHRHRDQDHEAAESQRCDQPCFQPHVDERGGGIVVAQIFTRMEPAGDEIAAETALTWGEQVAYRKRIHETG